MKILLVEDEIKLANAIKRALELQKHAIDVAYDGERGLDLAIGEKYDLLILDLMLPKVDGLVICRQVRSEKIATPILMLTAKGQVTDRVTGLDAGAELKSNRRGQYKPPRVNGDNFVDFFIMKRPRHFVGDVLESTRVLKKGGDVVKPNTFFRPVGNFADFGFEIHDDTLPEIILKIQK